MAKKIVSKRRKIFKIFGLAVAILILLFVGLVIWINVKYPPPSNNVPTPKDARLADPNLLYASFFSSGLCSNGKGEEGGCYTHIFLYRSGKYIDESGWEGLNNKKETSPAVEKQFTPNMVDKIIKQIKDSGIMDKSCPPVQNFDAWWNYQINLDGVKKVFADSPPYECQKTFWEIDALINSSVKSVK